MHSEKPNTASTRIKAVNETLKRKKKQKKTKPYLVHTAEYIHEYHYKKMHIKNRNNITVQHN